MKNFYSKFLALLALLFVGVGSAWANPGDEIKSPNDVVSGKSYYIKGVSTISKVETTFYFTAKDYKAGKIGESATPNTTNSLDEATPVTFTKTGSNWSLTTPSGLYIRPHSSNGQMYLSADELSYNLVVCDTKEGANKGMKIGPYVNGSDNWYIQVPTSAQKMGGYKTEQYGVTLIEAEDVSGKTKTSLSFGEGSPFTVNIGDSFTAPTLTATPSSILSSVTYTSSNTSVAEVNSTTGAVTINGLGTTTIKAKYEGDDDYLASSAEYSIKVVDPDAITATFDLSTNKYGWDATNDGNVYFDGSTYAPATEGDVTLSASGNVRMWGSDASSLRLYKDGVGSEPNIYSYGVGAITLKAAEGYVITYVTFTGSSLTLNPSEGTYTSPTWTGEANEITFEKGGSTPQIKTITVNYKAKASIPTFESLEALIAADQSYDAVNVTIDDEVYLAAVDPDMPGYYAVLLKNSGVMLAASGEDLGWKAGGKVTGTLTNVQWNKDGGVAGALMSKKPFWSDLTYTAPEVLVFNSIDELVAANLANGTAVTVTIEGTIKRAEYSANSKSYAVELDNNNLNLGSFTGKDYGWEIGGTVTGTLENVTYITENGEPGGEPGLASFDSDIFAGLTYTAPAKGTLNFVASNKDGYWATFSSTKDVIFDANDVVVYTVAADGDDLVMIAANNNSLSCVTDKSKDEGWVAGYYVQAGAGVLVNSADESVNYYYTTTDPYTENILTEIETDPEYNMLRPASAAMESTGYVFYKLAYASEAKDALGFYWGAANGAAFKSRYGSAYLAVPASQTSAKGFAFDSESTGIKSVETSNSKAPAYNIAGQRVNANVKGIVIMNGKKYINK